MLLKTAHERRNFVSIVAFHEAQEAKASEKISELIQTCFPVITIVDKRGPFAAAHPILHENCDKLQIHSTQVGLCAFANTTYCGVISDNAISKLIEQQFTVVSSHATTACAFIILPNVGSNLRG